MIARISRDYSYDRLIAACIQTNSTPDLATNLERIRPMIREARERGAELITLPENVSLIGAERDKMRSPNRHRKNRIRPCLSSPPKLAKQVRGF